MLVKNKGGIAVMIVIIIGGLLQMGHRQFTEGLQMVHRGAPGPITYYEQKL